MGRLIGIARREKKRAPMETLESAVITRESGVAEDSRGKSGNRQVTLLSARAWHETCETLGRPVDWTTRRANLLVEDMDLPRAAGHIVAIGDVRLETTIEVDPCSRMDEQVDGLTNALKPDWRGGIACKVLQGGTVSLGDDVELLE